MTGGYISDYVAAFGVHIAPREVHSLDLPTSMEVCHRAEGEVSQPVSSVGELTAEPLGLKLHRQLLVLMMHGSEKSLSLMGDTLRENIML